MKEAANMEKKVLDWKEYLNIARQAVAEGIVLLENNNGVLPLPKNEKVSIFGRIQTHYYKSGTGSGGMVNVSKVTDIVEGLKESNAVVINESLREVYEKWEETHPFDEGEGWGKEPWSQEEMEVSEELAKQAADCSDTAIVIIGRTAGEDRDNHDEKGAYCLTDVEEQMLKNVRKYFSRMVVLLNVGGIIDMNSFDQCRPDAILYVWQGGMTGGSGVADVLTGKVSPSGKLTDTIAKKIKDYPSDANFGDPKRNFYQEDIFVGYRYFETFAKDRVRYPFGYGLSYTTFSIEKKEEQVNLDEGVITLLVTVTNTGAYAGKEVVQVYAKAPQGKLGKASRVLVAFDKTECLQPGESEVLTFTIPMCNMASYDDSGVTGHAYAFVLEEGNYELYVGSDVRSASNMITFTLPECKVVEQLSQALAPVEAFERDKAVEQEDGSISLVKEEVPLLQVMEEERRKKSLPEELKKNTEEKIMLADVAEGKQSLDDFVAQFHDEDLASIIRGEGMGSSRVTAGTASAFGGVSDSLTSYGIPAVCCDDGPSGMRLDSGAKAFSLPNGTMLGCTFNVRLMEQLYALLGLEMISNHVECLLGPGMNLHRHPLNGRNFEYFSEDPYLTGQMAAGQLKGLKNQGVSGTIKHFCANNQEYKRRVTDSIVSERALRELYLKGFEIAVKSGYADSIMTTYGSVNGLFTAGNYDLNTTILREQWGFDGIVMTDWWASINMRGQEQNMTDFAQMARSQNDLYMVCPDGATNASGDNTLEALENGEIPRAELQRCAKNIVSFVMKSEAMKRQMGTGTTVEIINKPQDEDDIDAKDVEFITLDKSITIDLGDKESKAGTNYILAFDVQTFGSYHVTLTGSSELSELAQIPCTLFILGTPITSFTFNGTGGEDVSITKKIYCLERFRVMRLYVAKNGVKLKNIKFELTDEVIDPEKRDYWVEDL